MKKIGILTFHTAANYGAVLQAYALQKAIINLNNEHDVKTIDFRTEKHVKDYSLFNKKSKNLIKNIIVQTLSVPRNLLLSIRKRRFDNFVTNELKLTERFKTEKEFLDNIPKMDIYVTGSDQVFNYNVKYSNIYYLSFLKGLSKKIAYAPSFGSSELLESNQSLIVRDVLDFDNLSCREKDGADFLSRIVKKDIPVVLDPVFLLDKTEWLKVAKKPFIMEKYIFIYDLNGGKSLVEIARKIANATGCKIVCQTQNSLAFYKVDKLLFSSGPKEFLGLIANAEYVVTDSFHGTAFSLVFDIPFLSYIALPKASTRIRSLLNSLGISSQIVEHGKASNYEYTDSYSVEYKENLKAQKNKSLSFLRDAIDS